MANKTVTVLLKAITGAYRAEMTKAAAANQMLATSAGRGGKATQALQRFLGPTGLAAAKVAAGFGAVGGVTWALTSSVKAAMDFESSFAGVKKTLDTTGLTVAAEEATYGALAQKFRDLAKEIPASTEEINKVGEAAGQLGIETTNIVDFTRVMIDLGNTTDLSADQAAQSLARFANIMQMSQNDFDKLGSALVDLGNKSAATESEIAEMSLRLAGAGNVVGLTEAQVLGFATTLTSVGIKAEAGGSAFSRVFLNMQSAVQSGSSEVEGFAEVAGVSAEKFARQWSRDPAAAVQMFVEGLGRMIEAGGDVTGVLEELGLNEIRVRDALLRTAGAGDLLGQTLEIGTKAWAENNALQEEARKRYETTASRVEIARNNIKDLGIEMGNNLLPVLGGAADALTHVMHGFRGVGAEAESFGDRVAQGVGGAVQSLPGLNAMFREMAIDANKAAESTALFDNGLLTATTDLDVYMKRMQGVLGPLREVEVTQDGITRIFYEQSKAVDQINPSLKLMTEHQSVAAAATRMLGEQALGANESLRQEEEALAQMVEALDNMSESQEGAIEGIQAFTDPLLVYTENLEKKNEAERQAAEEQAASTKSQKDSWEDFFTETDASFKLYMKSLDQQLEDQRQWHKNLNTIREAAGQEYTDYLMALGPEHADLVASIADQEAEQIRKGAARQLELRKNGADEHLALLIRSGTVRIDNARRLSEEEVQAIATELGVTPNLVKKILGDANSAAARAMADMKATGHRGTQAVVDQIAEDLREGVNKAGSIIDRYAGTLSAGLNPILKSMGLKAIFEHSGAARRAAAGVAAQGGLVERARDGAHITSNMSVVYGEPETGGEAFIPLSPAKRPRSRMIAEETVRRLGGLGIQWMADGGFTAPSDVPKPPQFPNNNQGFYEPGRKATEHVFEETRDWVEANMAPPIAGGPGNWQKMWEVVSNRFKSAQLHSGHRPGAITATGNPSYHGMGRAIDISPIMTIFNWIAKNYAATELIYSPAGRRQEWHGRPHMYSGITRSMHWDHIHWAMKEGGILNALFQKKWVPGKSYRNALRELRHGAAGNKKFKEDFSFPGMSENAKTWNDTIANRYHAGHREFTRGKVVKALDFYLRRSANNREWNEAVGRRIKRHFPEFGLSDKNTDLDLPFRKFDKGGFLPTGVSIAYNGTGAPEPVGSMGDINIQVFVGQREITDIIDVRMNGRSRLQGQRVRAGA